ncbi:MAG: RNase P subunit p30 family protein [Promethearchaeota archaeon]
MKFYDLGIYSDLSSGKDKPEKMCEIAIELGFSGIGFADFNKLTPKTIKKIQKDYQNKCTIFTRATLIPKSSNELKKMVKNLRNQVDIIAVRNSNEEKNIYINAILDKRVDIISFVDIKEFESLEYGHFKMAKKNLTLIEIVTRNLIMMGGVRRSKLMRQMIKNCAQIIRSKAPFIISSGAQSKWELRAPRELIALAGLVKIPEKDALNAISNYPEKLIQKIKMIRDPNYIMAGVRVVPSEEEGKNNGN